MWPDNDIDKAFQRLNPPEPEPTPFPLDAWLRLETQLDQAVMARTVRRKLWRYFAAEVAVVALVWLGWLLWPAGPAAPTREATGKAQLGHAAGAPGLTGPGRVSHPRTPAAAGASADQPTSLVVPIPAPVPAAGAAPAAAATAPVATAPAAAPVAVESVAAAPASANQAAAIAQAPRLLTVVTPSALRPSARRQMPDGRAAALGPANGGAGTPEAFALKIPKKKPGSNASFPVAAAAANSRTPGAAGNARVRSAASRAALVPAERPMRRRGQPAGPRALGRADREAPAMATLNADGSARTPAADATDLAARPVPLRQPGPAELPVSLPAPALSAVVGSPADARPLVPAPAPRFYIGLVGAADVSTVRFAGAPRALPSAGVTLEYRLTERLRLTTGLLRAPKQYTARREDYDWGAYRTPVYQRDFQDVAGACTVLDVPLNLRYDAVVRPQYRLFGSAGLSSFFMQRERYSYDWTDQAGLHSWEMNVVNENQHWLSILNVSAGYERRLSARWSAQAEPYLKLPLAGVGLGKVRLASGGVLLGLKRGF